MNKYCFIGLKHKFVNESSLMPPSCFCYANTQLVSYVCTMYMDIRNAKVYLIPMYWFGIKLPNFQ